MGKNGACYMVFGARTKDYKGCILLYKSKDLHNWEFVSVPAGELDNMGYMWECPDTFKLGNKDVLLLSPSAALKLSYKIDKWNIVTILPDRGDRYFSKNIY